MTMKTVPQAKRVMVVDDDPSLLAVLKFLLKSKGLEVITAVSAEEALDKLGESLPHLIILDITLPGLDGIEFCRLVRYPSQTKPIPIIFLTARDTLGYIEQAFKLGAEEYLVKPVDHQKLLQLVEKYLAASAGKQNKAIPKAGLARSAG